MDKRLLSGVFVVLALLSLGGAPQPQRSVTYERYDVDIDVRSDGSLQVAETYQLRFEGEFRTGGSSFGGGSSRGSGGGGSRGFG